MTKDYIRYTCDRLSSSQPIFDIAFCRAINKLVTKVQSPYPCSFKLHLTIYPDGSIYTCHLLTHQDLQIEDNIVELNSDEFWGKYGNIEKWVLKQFGGIKCPPKVWFSNCQDMCVGANLSPAVDSASLRARFFEFARYESFLWDEFLREIYKIRSDVTKWQTTLKNLSTHPSAFYVR